MAALSIPPVPGEAIFEVFFDGECPLCVREINMLRRRDSGRKIAFTDIAAREFKASAYGRTQRELMGSIHGRDAQGGWHSGVEVFRHLYSAIGLERLVSVTRWPGIRQGLDLGYRVFSRYRLPLTGRKECADGRCALPGATEA